MFGKVVEKYVFVFCFEKSFEEVKIENCFRWVFILKVLFVGSMKNCLVNFLDFFFLFSKHQKEEKEKRRKDQGWLLGYLYLVEDGHTTSPLLRWRGHLSIFKSFFFL
jgi:hypothetical protein